VKQRRGVRHVALLEPGAQHLLEFEEGRERLRMTGQETFDGAVEVADAVHQLADRLEARGARDRSVVVVIRGFGVVHHMIELPPASPEIWAPVVQRELRRLEPGLPEPVVIFTPCGTVSRGQQTAHQLLVAAAPRHLLDELRDACAQRRILIDHVTVLPQALRRAYADLDGEAQTTVLLLMLESGPMLGYFHEGELWLIVEPPLTGTEGVQRSNVLREAMERGALHLKQLHRGAGPRRLLMGGPAADQQNLGWHLQEADGDAALEVTSLGTGLPFAGYGALADADADDGLSFGGNGARRQRRHRRVLHSVLGGAVVAALLFAASGVSAMLLQQQRAAEAQRATEARAIQVAPALDLLHTRRSHEQRVNFLSALDSEFLRIERILRELGVAAPAGLRFDALRLNRSGESWAIEVSGTAIGHSTAAAVSALHGFNAQLQRRLQPADAQLADFVYLDEAAAFANGGAAGVRFRLDLSVPAHRQAGT
jgi:hypothetical protein